MKSGRLATLFLAAIVALGVALLVPVLAPARGTQVGHDTPKATIDRVVSTGTIRCGYVPYPPGFIKDPATGKVSGVFPEILERAASNLGLKVEWTEEVGWGTMVEGLVAGRYDMIGSPVWPTSQRARVADFTHPIYYGGLEAFVRADDNRFSSGLSVLNTPEMRIATTDGEISDTVARADFPKAQRVSLPQLTDLSQLLLTVADGKADVTFAEPHVAFEFVRNNPGKLKSATPGNPLRVYPNTMMLRQSDDAFRRMLDTAITELDNSGVVEGILRKYEPYPGAFYRNARPIAVLPTK